MTNTNPYLGLPAAAFWKSGVAETPPHRVEDIYRKRFDIGPTDKIAAAGSCFAQHVSRHLRANNFNVMDVEPPPAWLPPHLHGRYGFSTYSARYGNIYTVAQLAQLARECRGAFQPHDAMWWKDGKVFDALRPAVEPEGLDSEAELRTHRTFHLAKVQLLFREMDVFVFTLGLTEGWVHRESGTVYPVAPGVIAGAYDARQHTMHNFGFVEMAALFDDFLASLRAIRGPAPLPRIILTVSPVPLTATASGHHVLLANTQSKSTLRALAGHLSETHPFVDYFPSYELVTNPAARGLFFDGNLRTVTSNGVSEVMKVFFAAHGTDSQAERAATTDPHVQTLQPAAVSDADIQCEDAILEAFANG